jgi:hypothetical protein
MMADMTFAQFKPRMIKTFCHGFLSMLLLVRVPLGPAESSCGEEDSYIVELEIEGFPPIILSQLPVIANETEIVEVRSEKDVIISKKPGKTRYGNIVLVMALDVFPDQLRMWRQEIIDGIFTKRWRIVTIKDRETNKVKIQDVFSEGWPSKLTYVYTGGKFFVHYEIVATTIQSKRFPLMPE